MTAPDEEEIASDEIAVDGKYLSVTTFYSEADGYDTLIFDKTPDHRHAGMVLRGYLISHESKLASSPEDAMSNHRDALDAARTEQPEDFTGRNNHRATAHGLAWECPCGDGGTTRTEQRTRQLALEHNRHPDRTPDA